MAIARFSLQKCLTTALQNSLDLVPAFIYGPDLFQG